MTDDWEDRPPIYPAEWLEEEAMQEAEEVYNVEEVEAVTEAAQRVQKIVMALSIAIDGRSNGDVLDSLGLILGSILTTADDGAFEIAINEVFRTADIWRGLILTAQSEAGETRQ